MSKPSYYNCTYQYQNNGHQFAVYVDINHKDTVNDFGFKLPGRSPWRPYFESFRQAVVGKSLGDLEEIGEYFYDGLDTESPPLFLLPYEMFLMAINQFTDSGNAHDLLSGQPYQELVCRCFGVYRQQLLQLQADNPEVDLVEVNNQLRAGAGCGRCVEDIEEILARPFSISQERSHGLSPVQLVLKVQDLINEWNGVAEEILIIDVSDNNFTLNKKLNIEQEKSLESLVTKKTGLTLSFSF